MATRGPPCPDAALGDQAAVLRLGLRQLPAARELGRNLEADVVARRRVLRARDCRGRRSRTIRAISSASPAGISRSPAGRERRPKRRRAYSSESPESPPESSPPESPASSPPSAAPSSPSAASPSSPTSSVSSSSSGSTSSTRGGERVAIVISSALWSSPSDELDALRRDQRAELKRVADDHAGDVGGDRLGDRGRQRRDRDLVGDVLEDAALLDAGSVLGADQLDRDVRLDLDVELDLLEVEVNADCRAPDGAAAP